MNSKKEINSNLYKAEWHSQNQWISSRLLRIGFDCYCVFVVPSFRNSVSPTAKLFADNLTEIYGLFGKQLRDEIRGLCRTGDACLTNMFATRIPNMWLEFDRTCSSCSGIFDLPQKFGFNRFSCFVTYPYRGRSFDHIFIAYSSRMCERKNIGDVLYHIEQWIYSSGFEIANCPNDNNSANKQVGGAKLSDKELECLKWVAAGKTMRDVSDILGISYKSVRYNLEKARNRYGFSSIQQVLVQATIDYDLSPFGSR